MTTQPETTPCHRIKVHPSHKYMLGRAVYHCPGIRHGCPSCDQPEARPEPTETVRGGRRLPAPPAPELRDQLCDAFIRLIRDYADRSIIAPGYMADTALAVVQPVIDEARATIARVRELHARTEERRAFDLSLHPIPTCTGCGERWPCPTTTALAPPVPADNPEASSAGIDWRDIAAQREEARCAAVSEANRANAVLAAITALAFDADLRPDVRLSRIRNLIDPADGGEQV